MDEEKSSRQERNAFRKEKNALREARQSDYVRELMDDLEGRPEEVSYKIPLELDTNIAGVDSPFIPKCRSVMLLE